MLWFFEELVKHCASQLSLRDRPELGLSDPSKKGQGSVMKNDSDQSLESAERGWKRHLLSSGIPLEYEVARTLSALNIATEADYAFTRPDGYQNREGSVDLVGNSFESFGKEDVAYKINLLIECKYRSRNKTLLLLPSHDEYGITLGATVNTVDAFSKVHIPMDSFVDFERAYPFAYKGVEIFEGGAIEKEFRHGIEQLRYASPYVLREEIDFQAGSNLEDVVPIFLAKILVTNAPIRMLLDGTGLQEIEAAKSLETISSSVGAAILHSDYGPDYTDHVKSVFDKDKTGRLAAASFHADQIEIHGKTLTRYSDPNRLMRELVSGNSRICRSIGSQFFVVNMDYLNKFLLDYRSACKNAYRQRTRTDRLLKRIRPDIRTLG